MYAWLGVTCHLQVWQNDLGLLSATAVIQGGWGWGGVERLPNRLRVGKKPLEKKLLLPFLPGFELATFRPRVRRSTSWACLDLPKYDLLLRYQPVQLDPSKIGGNRLLHYQASTGRRSFSADLRTLR